MEKSNHVFCLHSDFDRLYLRNKGIIYILYCYGWRIFFFSFQKQVVTVKEENESSLKLISEKCK